MTGGPTGRRIVTNVDIEKWGMMAIEGDSDERSERDFIRRTLIVLSLGSLVFLVWHMRALLLLLFGAVLVAVIFRAIAGPIHRWTRAPQGLAVGLAVLLVIGTLVTASWLFGNEVNAQVRILVDSLPEAWRSFEREIGEWGLGDRLKAWLDDAMPTGSGLFASVTSLVMSLGGGIADVVIVLVGGVYLASQPRLYRKGALKLVPAHRRELAGEAIEASGRALRLWLKGQLISMIIVGLSVGIGLWLIGVPSALVLGLLAAILEFIPLAGPIIAALPALLIALALGPETALWVLGLYIVVQQLEGNLIQPVVQQYAVELPAVILLFSLLAFGTLFGVLGIVLAAPLTVVVYVLVKRLYVVEALKTPTPIPGAEQS